jgi:hypothetical protein
MLGEASTAATQNATLIAAVIAAAASIYSARKSITLSANNFLQAKVAALTGVISSLQNDRAHSLGVGYLLAVRDGVVDSPESERQLGALLANYGETLGAIERSIGHYMTEERRLAIAKLGAKLAEDVMVFVRNIVPETPPFTAPQVSSITTKLDGFVYALARHVSEELDETVARQEQITGVKRSRRRDR